MNGGAGQTGTVGLGGCGLGVSQVCWEDLTLNGGAWEISVYGHLKLITYWVKQPNNAELSWQSTAISLQQLMINSCCDPWESTCLILSTFNPTSTVTPHMKDIWKVWFKTTVCQIQTSERRRMDAGGSPGVGRKSRAITVYGGLCLRLPQNLGDAKTRPTKYCSGPSQ
jgi:hypothetical protein